MVDYLLQHPSEFECKFSDLSNIYSILLGPNPDPSTLLQCGRYKGVPLMEGLIQVGNQIAIDLIQSGNTNPPSALNVSDIGVGAVLTKAEDELSDPEVDWKSVYAKLIQHISNPEDILTCGPAAGRSFVEYAQEKNFPIKSE